MKRAGRGADVAAPALPGEHDAVGGGVEAADPAVIELNEEQARKVSAVLGGTFFEA